MKKVLTPIAAALSALVLGASFGAAEETGEAEDSGLSCVASGYDVIIYNNGVEPIVAGTEINWAVPFDRKQGSYTLPIDLPSGGAHFVSGVMGSTYLTAQSICELTLN